MLDGVDFDSFVQIFTGDRNKTILHKNDDQRAPFLNEITKEPFIGCGLTGKTLVEDVLPPLYYNAKINPPKPVQLVGPSGSGKTSIAECFIRNFANANPDTIKKGVEKDIVAEKKQPILRIQNYANIMNEDIVGEWNAIKMLFAKEGENIFNKDKYFRLGALTQGLYDPGNKKYTGRGVLLDEITRAYEDTMNVYLEPLRERKVTAGGECFGECKPGDVMPRFFVMGTANEGDVGTIDMPTALQTRFSRVFVDFISPEDEQAIIEKELRTLTTDEKQIAYISGSPKGSKHGIPCLMEAFRGMGENKVSLTVKPTIKDGTDLAKMFIEKGVTRESMSNARARRDIAAIVSTVLGKNVDDARKVDDALKRGVCGISST